MASYTLDEREHATALAALRFWQRHGLPRCMDSKNRLPEDDIATNNGTLEPMSMDEIDTLCERLNCEDKPAPVELSECCHAEIGYDAWVDSNGELNGGPFDNNICTNCSMESPPVWDGESPPWLREEREGGADLPDGVEEPPEEPTAETTMAKLREVAP